MISVTGLNIRANYFVRIDAAVMILREIIGKNNVVNDKKNKKNYY